MGCEGIREGEGLRKEGGPKETKKQVSFENSITKTNSL